MSAKGKEKKTRRYCTIESTVATFAEEKTHDFVMIIIRRLKAGIEDQPNRTGFRHVMALVKTCIGPCDALTPHHQSTGQVIPVTQRCPGKRLKRTRYSRKMTAT